MTRSMRRFLLILTAALMAVLLAAFLATETRDEPPEDLAELGAWLNDHPGDWLAAGAIAEASLDSDVPRRIDLWRAAYDHALRLSPHRPHARTSFVRAGLFHWYELGGADRAAVLRAAAPLLRDPADFSRMHRPLWDLTHDFAYLRRHAPQTERALTPLRDIAAMYGLFAEYREVRDAIDRMRLQAFEKDRAKLSPPQLLSLLPPKLTRGDEPLVRRFLQELQRRPFDAGNAGAARGRADELVTFVIRRGLTPLDGLEALIDSETINPVTRARLAIALGRADEASKIELIAVATDAEWLPYYLERAAFEERKGDAEVAALYRRRASVAREETAGQWIGTCGRNEICRTARTRMAAERSGAPLTIHLQNAQSDEIPPYVEIYVEDARVAEGPVEEARAFRVNAAVAGLNRVEVRLINPRTRNGIQRRVRLS